MNSNPPPNPAQSVNWPFQAPKSFFLPTSPPTGDAAVSTLPKFSPEFSVRLIRSQCTVAPRFSIRPSSGCLRDEVLLWTPFLGGAKRDPGVVGLAAAFCPPLSVSLRLWLTAPLKSLSGAGASNKSLTSPVLFLPPMVPLLLSIPPFERTRRWIFFFALKEDSLLFSSYAPGQQGQATNTS